MNWSHFYFVRQFNLTAALYGETDTHAMAGVVIRANSSYKDLNGIAGARACINEFNGIGMSTQFT